VKCQKKIKAFGDFIRDSHFHRVERQNEGLGLRMPPVVCNANYDVWMGYVSFSSSLRFSGADLLAPVW
jgi:hypothetical protein